MLHTAESLNRRAASTRRLDLLIGRAVVSDSFRAGLMNGQRARLLHEWQLEPDETAQVMAIRAETFETFAQGVCRILGEGGPDGHRTQPVFRTSEQ